MSVHLSGCVLSLHRDNTPERLCGASSRNNIWLEPETNRRKLCIRCTTTMFSSIDKRDKIIGSFCPFVRFFLVTIGHKTNVQWLGNGPPTSCVWSTLSLQGVVCMFTCGCSTISTTDWHATPIITDWSFTVLFSLSSCAHGVDSQSILFSIFHVAHRRSLVDSDQNSVAEDFLPSFKNSCSG